MNRFSFNQATARDWPVPDLLAGCAAAGVRWVGLWREQVAEYGLERTVKAVQANGLAVSTLCRGGFFTTGDWYPSNRRAIDEAAALGAPVLVLVCGGLPAGRRSLDAARDQVVRAVEALAPHASAAGVRLAVEPLHPMFAADRCVVCTLAQALDIAERFDPETVGVAIDTYHVWWDDTLYRQIARAAGRIAIFQLADWATPLPAGALTGRAMPDAGCVELSRIWAAVDDTGYRGPVEVEIFNEDVWSWPGERALSAAVAGYQAVRVQLRAAGRVSSG
ncbi:MAG: sugar phosphate isomerase/epimerase [Micromonosporaceae bacterium]|nr:sugar phosphate isomerase/epimerase [Micromonosporaceae bacterium]